jgi:hypothetical protein
VPRPLQRLIDSLRASLPRKQRLAAPNVGDNPGGTPPALAPAAGWSGRLRLRDYFTLRPYGNSLITPAVAVWLGSAWTVILLMASIEGFVWGAVGASLVPSASPWLAPPVALFMFLLMFMIVWIVDSSLIMSERPSLRLHRAPAGDDARGIGPSARWFVGILVRVGIVAISLYVTAPFIEKLIRADDIEGYHRAQVEQYFKQRDATLQAQVRARVEQLDAGLLGRIQSLEQEIERLTGSLAAEQARRERIEGEYAPEIEVVSRDLAAARARVGDELLGRDGRPEGYGPEARKWDARATLLEQQLAEVQAERDARLADVQAAIAEQQQRIAERSDQLQQVRLEQQQVFERVTNEVAAEQPPAAPPKLSFAARSKALNALRNSPEEAGVPHFETVEGFAQAALGILFFALIALKLFEPAAVHAYFSEQVQFQYRKYLAGGLSDVPGFAQHDDPIRRLSPAEFQRLWDRYERDPDAYFEQIKAVVNAEARVRRLLADQAYELELLERQRDDIDARLALERRRRESELAARERQLELELAEAGKRLAGETEAEIERLEQQREQARQAHRLAMDELARRYAAERERLEQELADSRRQWEQEKAVEEDELRRTRQAFEDQRKSARDKLRLRQMALDDRRRLREREQQRLAAESEREQDRAGRQLRIDQTRVLLADEHQVLARQRAELSDMRVRIGQRAGSAAEAQAELRQLAEQLAEREQRMNTLRHRIDEAERAAPAGRSLFAGADPAQRTRRHAERRLAQLEREREQLQARHAAVRSSIANLDAERLELERGAGQLADEAAATSGRIEHYRQRLDALLLARG